ncbi:hypothetical protein ACIHFD_49335 [Nonomuraea sp. NPDC051941]|uniref:hypothetical protein n=1 Tax=Nonomuraea sp. NPDC051941 TaxID=3364373 RepID=UPI0037C5F8DE
MAALADADAVPPVIAYLAAHPAVTAALGGPGRVGGDNAPPYPRLRIADMPGGSENLRTKVVGQRIQIEALGMLDGPTIGKEALRRILYTVLDALAQLPEAPAGTGRAVVSDVGSAVAGGYVPLADGRPRYVATLTVTVRPGPG